MYWRFCTSLIPGVNVSLPNVGVEVKLLGAALTTIHWRYDVHDDDKIQSFFSVRFPLCLKLSQVRSFHSALMFVLSSPFTLIRYFQLLLWCSSLSSSKPAWPAPSMKNSVRIISWSAVEYAIGRLQLCAAYTSGSRFHGCFCFVVFSRARY